MEIGLFRKMTRGISTIPRIARKMKRKEHAKNKQLINQETQPK